VLDRGQLQQGKMMLRRNILELCPTILLIFSAGFAVAAGSPQEYAAQLLAKSRPGARDLF